MRNAQPHIIRTINLITKFHLELLSLILSRNSPTANYFQQPTHILLLTLVEKAMKKGFPEGACAYTI